MTPCNCCRVQAEGTRIAGFQRKQPHMANVPKCSFPSNQKILVGCSTQTQNSSDLVRSLVCALQNITHTCIGLDDHLRESITTSLTVNSAACASGAGGVPAQLVQLQIQLAKAADIFGDTILRGLTGLADSLSVWCDDPLDKEQQIVCSYHVQQLQVQAPSTARAFRWLQRQATSLITAASAASLRQSGVASALDALQHCLRCMQTNLDMVVSSAKDLLSLKSISRVKHFQESGLLFRQSEYTGDVETREQAGSSVQDFICIPDAGSLTTEDEFQHIIKLSPELISTSDNSSSSLLQVAALSPHSSPAASVAPVLRSYEHLTLGAGQPQSAAPGFITTADLEALQDECQVFVQQCQPLVGELHGYKAVADQLMAQCQRTAVMALSVEPDNRSCITSLDKEHDEAGKKHVSKQVQLVVTTAAGGIATVAAILALVAWKWPPW